MFDWLRKLWNKLHRRETVFASIGDVSTRKLFRAGVYPKIVCYDNRTCRKPMEPLKLPRSYRVVKVRFGGRYDIGLLRILAEACRRRGKTAFQVIGEEDKMLYGVALFAPLGSKVVAGEDVFVIDKALRKLARRYVEEEGRCCFYVL